MTKAARLKQELDLLFEKILEDELMEDEWDYSILHTVPRDHGNIQYEFRATKRIKEDEQGRPQ